MAIPEAQPQSLKIVKKEEGILVKEGEEKVLFYQEKPQSFNGDYTRNHYIHPLHGLKGEVLTEDFPKDHLHQRGIFWAWHQVIVEGKKMGDMWLTENFEWQLESIMTNTQNNLAILKPEVLWKSADLKGENGKKIPFVKEETTIAVHPVRQSMRKIDFTIQLSALKEEVYLGGSDNDKGYGGFSARIKLPDDIEFTARYGKVEPQRTAVEESPWMDFTGSFTGNKKSGILILCHPSNPGFPPGWIIRDKGSMQNPVYPGRKPIPLSQSKPLTLRYRMVIHDSKLEKQDINKLLENYKKQTNY